jgi:hypothetical protein
MMSVANDNRMAALICRLLQMAEAGGMPHTEAGIVYDRFRDCFYNLDHDAAEAFFNEEIPNILLLDPHSHPFIDGPSIHMRD